MRSPTYVLESPHDSVKALAQEKLERRISVKTLDPAPENGEL
jgi:hypothetical protein